MYIKCTNKHRNKEKTLIIHVKRFEKFTVLKLKEGNFTKSQPDQLPLFSLPNRNGSAL